MQLAVCEFARHVAGMEGANSTEFDLETPYPVIDLLPEQKEIADMGGTMRLGADPVKLHAGTRIRELYAEAVVYERHRHRYEVNNHLRRRLEAAGLVCSGTSPDERLVEAIELPADQHPFFVASQYHPEFKSRPERPAPLFREFVGAALAHAGRTSRPRRPATAPGRAATRPHRPARAPRPTPPRGEAHHRRRARAAPRDVRRRCAGSRARRGVSARARTGSRASCGRMGLEVEEDDAGTRVGSDAGNLLARIPGTGPDSILLCAHMDTVPLTRPGRAGPRRRRLGERRRRDPRRRQQVRRGGDPRARAARHVGARAARGRHRAAVHDLRGGVAARRQGVRRERGCAAGSGTSSTTRRRSARSCSPRPTHYRIDAELRGRAAHAGVRPEVGRSAIAAAASAIAAMRLGRLDAETTANVGTIEGGTAINVIPERCQIVAEVRSLDRDRAETVATEMVDHLQEAADAAECDLDVTVERVFEGYRIRPPAPEVAVAERALRACGYEPEHIVTGGASDANTLECAGFPCVCLADGTEHNHEPTERISVDALEGMFELALAVVDEAGRARRRRRGCGDVTETGRAARGRGEVGGTRSPRRRRTLPPRRRRPRSPATRSGIRARWGSSRSTISTCG